MEGKKRKDLTIKEKISILEQYDKLPKMGQRKAAVQLKISQPLLCKILKKRDEIENECRKNENLDKKRKRSGKYKDVESALKLWFTNVREQDARVNGPLMRRKAEELAKKMGENNFVATDGWFYRWKTRENIVYKHTRGEQKEADFLSANIVYKHTQDKEKDADVSPASTVYKHTHDEQKDADVSPANIICNHTHDEQKDADVTPASIVCKHTHDEQKDADVSPANVVYKHTYGEQKDAHFSSAETWIKEEWPKIIVDYSPESVYNACETGLYYRALPEHTYLIKNESTKGCKTWKEHVTVLCCMSMSGTKERLLVIGKSKNPGCFKGVNKLPVEYYANSNACMTVVIFNEWLMKWDRELKHKILLIIDYCTARVVNVRLKHIKVVFLHPNTISLIQPCNQSIIQSFKAYYRCEMRARILENVEDNNQQISANEIAKKTNLLETLHLLSLSWKQLSVKKLCQNCFALGGFLKTPIQPEEPVHSPDDMTETDFEEWLNIDQDIQVAAVLTEADICQTGVCKNSEVAEFDDDADKAEQADKPPTNAEMRKALQILRFGVQYRSTDFERQYDYEIYINDLLRKSRQTTMNEFL